MRLAYIGVNELVSLHFVACFLPFNQEGSRDFAFLSHRWKIEQCQRDSQICSVTWCWNICLTCTNFWYLQQANKVPCLCKGKFIEIHEEANVIKNESFKQCPISP